MLLMICGPSASGKSEIEKIMHKNGVRGIIPYTSRAIRPGENPDSYHFVTPDNFRDMVQEDKFVYWEEYSQERFYGLTKKDVLEAAGSQCLSCAILTPGGIRSVQRMLQMEQYRIIFVDAPLGKRVERYIKRVGVDAFSYDDLNEVFARVNRDFGMFLNMENESDFVIHNDNDNFSILELIIREILVEYKDSCPAKKIKKNSFSTTTTSKQIAEWLDTCSNEQYAEVFTHLKKINIARFLTGKTKSAIRGTVDIGFGIDDETEFDVCNAIELAECWMEFCHENNLDVSDINYVEVLY